MNSLQIALSEYPNYDISGKNVICNIDIPLYDLIYFAL